MGTIYTYNYLYPSLGRGWVDYIKEPYAKRLEGIGEFYAPIHDSLITNKTQELFQPTFVEGILNQTETPFLDVLGDNNVYDWKPENPIALYHSKNDSLVDILNSESMVKSIENHGGKISLQLIEAEDHRAAAIPFYLDVLYDIMMKQEGLP